MTTISQEQEHATPVRQPSQRPLLRQRSEQLQLQDQSGHPHRRPSAAGSLSLRAAPTSPFPFNRQLSTTSSGQQRPAPHPASLSHFGQRHHSLQQPGYHYHHYSHPRLSQKHRQKLFSRSRGYRSVCSGSESQHASCTSRSRCSRDRDEDVEACHSKKSGFGILLKKVL